MKEVEKVCGLKRWTIYKMVKSGEFPGSYKLGERASGWKESEIKEWLDSRPKA